MLVRSFLCTVLFAPLAAAQATGATVSGVVHDSIARSPLAGARVQLVATDSLGRFGRTVISDSLGRFELSDVPTGRYAIGFFHPLLDSLGLEPTLRDVRVDGNKPVHVDLAIPAPARLRAAICGARSAHDSGTVVVGIVRDSRGRAPVTGATVTAEWLEYALSRQGLSRRIQQITATTAENGWFSLCDVPTAGTIVLTATRGSESTDRIDLVVPTTHFLHRELYLGPARTGATAGNQLSGTVVTAANGTPIVGAQVKMADGSEARANERGEWNFPSAPVGTRVIEAHAIGFYPERIVVDIVDSAAPLRIALATTKSVLDTVRVTTSRNMDRNMREFEQRRAAGGIGHFLTRDDIDRRHPIVSSDIFRMVPGLFVERTTGETRIQMRGTFAERCSPAIYIDGQFMSVLSADDVDNLVQPDDIAGIEVYVGAAVPPQFSTGMGGVGRPGGEITVCGSIVIWTRPHPVPSSDASWKSRVAMVAGATGVGLLIGAVVLVR